MVCHLSRGMPSTTQPLGNSYGNRFLSTENNLVLIKLNAKQCDQHLQDSNVSECYCPLSLLTLPILIEISMIILEVLNRRLNWI